ncbi:SCO7613 C-terminal domain-containing membrane protein [Bifidobacterium leontopitheci]|uniref:Uncharacterized protein n=1 Tax=Bifidobacterium leontopitheci TaxID=2650774 RepID=A0A6I1GKQ0_9BIFI|nr:hypothetical protein [Bifidobacterium leontopitheci]KAB7790019.1 hypothetical protein F7D09_1504 [Bifidobacterium leontopitheci]
MPPQPGRPPQRSGAQVLLLATGVALIAIALITFASIGYTTFGKVGRIVAIGVLGAVAIALSLPLSGRFRISAEGVAWVGLIALTVDSWLIGDLPAFAGDRTGSGAAATGGSLLVCAAVSLAASMMHGRTARPLRTFGLYAVGASLFGVILLMSLPALPRALGDGIDVAVAAAAVAIAVLARTTPAVGGFGTSAGQSGRRPASPATRAPQPNVPFQQDAAFQPQPAPGQQPTPQPAPCLAPESQPALMSGSQPNVPFPQTPQPQPAEPWQSRMEQFVQPPTLPITPRLPAPAHGAERVVAATIGALALMLITLGDYQSSKPGVSIVAVVAYVLLLALVGMTWACAATVQPTTPEGTPLPAPLQAMSMESMRWIVSLAAAVACIGLTAVINDGPLQADGATMLLGVTALAIGMYWMRRRPMLRSWAALWPGLLTLFVPTYVTAMGHFDVLWRFVALLVAATACMVAGALLRWKAPLTMGAVMLVVVAVSRLWPWIAVFSRDFWWVWLLACGIVLVIAAIRYEASMASVRSLRRRLADMR